MIRIELSGVSSKASMAPAIIQLGQRATAKYGHSKTPPCNRPTIIIATGTKRPARAQYLTKGFIGKRRKGIDGFSLAAMFALPVPHRHSPHKRWRGFFLRVAQTGGSPHPSLSLKGARVISCGWRRMGPWRSGARLASLRGARARQGGSATATVLDCQAHAATFACHGVRCLSIAFRMINSFRMHAVRATFFAFPAAHKR